MGMRVKKQFVSLLLCGAMLLAPGPQVALAAGAAGEGGAPGMATSESAAPAPDPAPAQNGAEAPAASAAPAAPAPRAQANRLLQATEPVEEAVKNVQAQIDALPTADELAGMEREAQQKVYNQLQTAYDAYEMLNEEQKAQIKGAEIFDSLFEVFNGMTNAMEAVGNFNVEGDSSTYSYANGVLTVNNGANLIISTNSQTSDRIVIASGANATITLSGVNIKGAEASIVTGASAQSPIDLSTGATLTLILKDNSSNTITGGSGGIGGTNGAPGIHVPDSAALIIQGGGSLTVTGGSSTANFGGTGIGGTIDDTEASSGVYRGEDCGTVIILSSGTVNIVGGSSSMLGAGGADIGGGQGTGVGGGDGSNGQGIRPSSDGSYTVWGNLSVPSDVEFPDDIKLNIPSGTTLKLPENFTWPENITVTGGGTIAPDTM